MTSAASQNLWPRRSPAQAALGLGVLLLLTFVVYWPCLHGSFLWDDDVMLTQNRLVRSASGLPGIWFSTQPFDYCPLTLTSLWAEWPLWQLNPTGYHVTNVLLHALSAFLLWRILARLKVPGAFLAAAVFAVHPVCVASVAWIAERKNTLSLLFFLLSLLWYLRFDEGERAAPGTPPAPPVVPSRSLAVSSVLYLLSLAAFILALLCKASVVTLPCVLLLCCWWRRDRITRRDLARTAPFFLLALALGLVTIWFQLHKAMGGPAQATDPLLVRLLGGSWAVWFYLVKALVPVNLTLIYPRWAINPASPWAYLPALLLLGLLAALWRARAGAGRPLLFGLGCFIVTLLPVLGVFDMYFLSFSRVADHWQYLPIIAIIALAVGAAAARVTQWFKSAAPGLAALLVAALAVASWQRAVIYASPLSLWRDAAAKTPHSWVTRNHYGNMLDEAGRLDDAIAQYTAVQQFMPTNVDACINLGIALTKQGNLDAALAQLRRALALSPHSPDAHFNLASVLSRQGKFDEAIPHYHEALRSYFYLPETRTSLGTIYSRQGKPDAALAEYREALRFDPDFAPAHQGLADLLLSQGRFQEALDQYALAAKANPALDSAQTHYALANALLKARQPVLARQQYEAALKSQPDFAEADYQLGVLLLAEKDPAAARRHWEAALRLKPDWLELLNNYAWLLATNPDPQMRDGTQAVALASRAVELTRQGDPGILDTLAAAHAEAAQFPEAVAAAEQALKLAEAAGNKDLVTQLRARLDLYRTNRPWRD